MTTRPIAVVCGASRGVGRGVAEGLGEAGWRVVCIARSTRFGHRTEGRRETIEDTVEAVTELGGDAVPYVADATDPRAMHDAAAYVLRRIGRPLLLVNAVWGGNEGFDGERHRDGAVWGEPFWRRPLDHYERAWRTGVHAALAASRAFAPGMVQGRAGLVVTITFDGGDAFLGDSVYDTAKAAMVRLASAMAHDLAPYGVASVALTPGHVATERVAEAGRAADATETPRFVGRVVAALATDPEPMNFTGRSLFTADIACDHGITDLDGRRPSRFLVPKDDTEER